jgi:hypothetical protein
VLQHARRLWCAYGARHDNGRPTSKMPLMIFDKRVVYFELLRTQKQIVCDQETVFKTHPLAFCRAKQLEGGAGCVGHCLLLLTRQSLAPRATPRTFLARSSISSPKLFNQSPLVCSHMRVWEFTICMRGELCPPMCTSSSDALCVSAATSVRVLTRLQCE